MARTVSYGHLDSLLGLSFAANAFVTIAASAVVGSITNNASSPNQVLNYQGMAGTLGKAFLSLTGTTFRIAAVDDATDSLTIDAYVGRTLVGEMTFTVAGFSAVGIALASMPIDALVSQAGNLGALNGAVFLLGLDATDAINSALNFGIGGAYSFISGAAVHYATSANPAIHGGTGPQLLIGLSGDDSLTAGPQKNVIRAGPGTTVIHAGSGADTIYGGSGTSTVYGSTGGMTVIGGTGPMTIHTGTGQAVITCSTGQETLIFSPGHTGGMTLATADVIQQFHANPGNVIDLSAFDALLPAGSSGHLSFIGNAAFDGGAGELRYTATATGVRLFADLNGDKLADFTLTLPKLSTISASDFIL